MAARPFSCVHKHRQHTRSVRERLDQRAGHHALGVRTCDPIRSNSALVASALCRAIYPPAAAPTSAAAWRTPGSGMPSICVPNMISLRLSKHSSQNEDVVAGWQLDRGGVGRHLREGIAADAAHALHLRRCQLALMIICAEPTASNLAQGAISAPGTYGLYLFMAAAV